MEIRGEKRDQEEITRCYAVKEEKNAKNGDEQKAFLKKQDKKL
jgi:hypothetical protein